MKDNHLDQLYELHAKICQTLAHPTRLKIINSLRQGEKKVNDIADELGLPQPTISRNLTVMGPFGVVQSRRDGSNIFYWLGNEKIVTAYDTMHEFAMDYLESNLNLLKVVQGT